MTAQIRQTNLDKRVMDFIIADKYGISVDWAGLADFKDREGYEGRHLSAFICDNLIDFLKQAGVLVYSGTKGSYAVVGGGVIGGNIGPLYSVAGVNFNFTTQEQARAYEKFAGRLHGCAVEPVHIVQVTE